jgi:hypothetical protein
MARTYTPEALAQRVFTLMMTGLAAVIVAMVYLGWIM